MKKSVRKALVALVATGAFAVGTILAQTGSPDVGDWLWAAGTVLGSGALVYIATNVPGVFGGAIKAFVGGGGALVASLIAAYQVDGVLSTSDLLLAASAGLTVLVGTYEVPDETPPPATTG